jgi:hypothetical protein
MAVCACMEMQIEFCTRFQSNKGKKPLVVYSTAKNIKSTLFNAACSPGSCHLDSDRKLETMYRSWERLTRGESEKRARLDRCLWPNKCREYKNDQSFFKRNTGKTKILFVFFSFSLSFPRSLSLPLAFLTDHYRYMQLCHLYKHQRIEIRYGNDYFSSKYTTTSHYLFSLSMSFFAVENTTDEWWSFATRERAKKSIRDTSLYDYARSGSQWGVFHIWLYLYKQHVTAVIHLFWSTVD